jgi:hypothetical protein
MHSFNQWVLALDLEGTLITNHLERRPRPYLHGFLKFCCDHFDRLVLFTAVPQDSALRVISELVDQGHAPKEVLDRLEYVEWDGEYKDLSYVPDAQLGQILLVDDFEGYVKPDQKRYWIPIERYDPYLVVDDDEALMQVQRILAQILSKNAGSYPESP